MKAWRWVPLLAVLACLAAPQAHAATLTYVSDLLSASSTAADASAPGGQAQQTLTFTLTHALPPSGSITITPQSGAFDIPAGFDYTDVDLALWSGSAWVEQPLAAAAGAAADGVSVTAGTRGSVTITLSSGAGIAAKSKVEVRLGTNASYGATSTLDITNPAAVGSYRIGIATRDAGGALIDSASAMIATVEPVGLNILAKNTAPTRSNGSPSGTIAADNSTVELSLTTDGPATCRYSTAADTPYASMTHTFTELSGNVYSAVVSGLQNGTAYAYYVRCVSAQGAVNVTDYPISFQLDTTPISNTSVTAGGGTVGVGPYPNGSSELYLAGLTLAGLTAPGSSVVVLNNGAQAATAQANAAGAFSASLPSLERGTYSVGVYSVDAAGVKTSTYTATFSVTSATNNTLTGILLPPTLTTATTSVAVGAGARVFGQTAPSSTVVLSMLQTGGTGAGGTQTLTATSSLSGAWSLALPAQALSAGTYTLRAYTIAGNTQSDKSLPLYLGVGQHAASGASSGDLNGDGKVNLVDFSILLTSWGTSNPAADLNGDGTVNLADFSIMLFNWTG